MTKRPPTGDDGYTDDGSPGLDRIEPASVLAPPERGIDLVFPGDGGLGRLGRNWVLDSGWSC
jgi:hypothetical protein